MEQSGCLLNIEWISKRVRERMLCVFCTASCWNHSSSLEADLPHFLRFRGCNVRTMVLNNFFVYFMLSPPASLWKNPSLPINFLVPFMNFFIWGEKGKDKPLIHGWNHRWIGKIKMALGWQLPNVIEQKKWHAHLEGKEGENGRQP